MLQKDNPKVRNSSIELLRVLALIMIMFYHFANHGNLPCEIQSVGENFFAAKCFRMFGKVGVNIFIIISCWFLQYDINFVYARHKIKDTWIIVFFYSVSIFLFVSTIKGSFSIAGLVKALVPISSSVNWYATAYILFLILLPIISKGVNSLTQKEHRIIALILAFYFCCLQTVLGESGVFALNHFTNVTWFIVVYVIIGYIKRYIDYKKIPLLCYLGISILMCTYLLGSVYLIDYKDIALQFKRPETSVYLMQINYFPVFVLAICLFLCFERVQFKSIVVNYFGEAVFGVYLMHDNDLINNYLWTTICKSQSLLMEDMFF